MVPRLALRLAFEAEKTKTKETEQVESPKKRAKPFRDTTTKVHLNHGQVSHALQEFEGMAWFIPKANLTIRHEPNTWVLPVAFV